MKYSRSELEALLTARCRETMNCDKCAAESILCQYWCTSSAPDNVLVDACRSIEAIGSNDGIEVKESHKDNVNHPDHYCQGGVECIEALKAATSNLIGIEAVCTANAIKYLWRWKIKNGSEDLKKAKWYIEKLLEELEEVEDDG